jgi:hypothetical protein
MKHYERELFVSRIRSGIYIVEHGGIKLKVVTPTIEEELYINEAYNKVYEESLEDDFMTEEQALKWMESKGLWTKDDEEKINTIKKDMDTLRVEIFNNRNKVELRERIRKFLRAAEEALIKQSIKKNSFISNTCEGMATVEKSYELIKSCTYYGNEKYDFSQLSVEFVLHLFQEKILSEKQIRELARNEPWRSIWIMKDSNSFNLFSNKDRELSVDQKNLLVWSRMYDNIQESMDYPTDDVVNDDDLLDGWFVVQRKKREKERAESDFDNSTKNDKIKNAGEVFIMASNKSEAEKIGTLNDFHNNVIKKQRIATVKANSNPVTDLQFQDIKIDMQSKSNQMFKDKFRR